MQKAVVQPTEAAILDTFESSLHTLSCIAEKLP